MIEDEGYRTALGVEARKEVFAKYSWDAHVKKTLDGLRTIMKRR